MKNHDRLVLVTVIAFGLAMRAPIVTIPLIIDQLARQLKTAVGNLGILTTIPLIMFLLFSIVGLRRLVETGRYLANAAARHGAGWTGHYASKRFDAFRSCSL